MKQDLPTMINKFKLGDAETLQRNMKGANYSSYWFPMERDLFSDQTHTKLTKHYPSKCQSMKFGLEAKWRSLVNQGYIAKGQPRPEWFSKVPDMSLQKMDIETRFKLMEHGIREIDTESAKYNSTEMKEMKVAMFEEALATLTTTQICKIEEIFKPDFVLFNYPRKCVTAKRL